MIQTLKFKYIFGYGSQTRLLITNWLPFDIKTQVRLENQKEWQKAITPRLSLTSQDTLPAYSSIHQNLSLKNHNTVYSVGNFGRFSIHLTSPEFGIATILCNQVNAFGVWSYNLKYTLYSVRHRSGLNYNIYEIMGRDRPKNWNWMEKLLQKKPQLRVNEITMPGSHDSGMIINRFSFIRRLTENQYEDILEQLRSGIRYFDIRVTFKNGEYVIYHGGNLICAVGITLQSAIDDINAFFQHYGPKQTVFFVITKTRSEMKSDRRLKMIKKLHAEIKNVICVSEMKQSTLASERLGNLQGRTVLVYDREDFMGNDEPIVKFQQLKGFQSNQKWEIASPQCLKVYDSYSNTNLIDEMVADQNKKLEKFGGYGKNYLFLYSFTLTVQSALRLSLQHYSIELLGNISRALLPIQLNRMRKGELNKPNIIYYDFIDSWSCAAIIQLNY